MISRGELKRLQAHRDYPSVSLLAPTSRTAPANQKDPIVVKNLLTKALDRLQGEFNKREVASLIKNLNKLVERVDWEHSLDGLALFASKDSATAIQLPFKVKPRVVIDATFATRDLVFTLNRAPRYLVLVLSEKPTRLFEASTNVLTEVKAKPFPMVHKGAGGASKLPGGQGINRSAVRDESHREFFRKVDGELIAIQKEDPLPVVVVGVDRYLAFYHEVTKNSDAIVGLVAGSHDSTSPSSLGKLTWPVFQAGSTQRRTRALVRLADAVKVNRHASGIDQVWRAAFEKRCQTLLVETDFEYPADLSEDGASLLPYTVKGPAALDDAVDEVIERVMTDGGEVFFYDPGVLDLHQKIAAASPLLERLALRLRTPHDLPTVRRKLLTTEHTALCQNARVYATSLITWPETACESSANQVHQSHTSLKFDLNSSCCNALRRSPCDARRVASSHGPSLRSTSDSTRLASTPTTPPGCFTHKPRLNAPHVRPHLPQLHLTDPPIPP